MTPTTVDILLEARDILAGAKELGGGPGAMACAVVEEAPCVEAAVMAAAKVPPFLYGRFLDRDYWPMFSPDVRKEWPGLCHVEQALLTTRPPHEWGCGEPALCEKVWHVSDSLHRDLGPVEAKRVAVGWLDDAARWAKDEGAE